MRRQEKLDIVEKKNLRKRKLLEKYNKDIVWVKWWKIQERIFKEVRKKLAKIEVCFFREEILKRRVISELKTADLVFFYFSFSFSFLIFFIGTWLRR